MVLWITLIIYRIIINVKNLKWHFILLYFRWEAAKAQFYTASVGMMGAVAALLLDNGSGATQNNDNVSSFINTNLILAFSAGGFMHIAMVSILPDLIQEKNPKEAFIHFLLRSFFSHLCCHCI